MKNPKVGHRVEIHPGCDLWMRGARFGVVVKVGEKLAAIRMDHKGVKGLVKLPFDRFKAIDDKSEGAF